MELKRRAFLHGGALVMLAATLGEESDAIAATRLDKTVKPSLTVGYFTDIHYADTDDRGARNYRTSLVKVEEAVDWLNHKPVTFVVHGGDLIDALPSPTPESELRFLKQINKEFTRLKVERHYVLGNHCIFSLTKPEFLDTVGKKKSYYSFDKNGFHFVILDACYRKDGVDYARQNFDYRDTDIPAPEQEWLIADLKTTNKKTIVFVHQRLDLKVGDEDAIYSCPAVRDILEKSGKVLAVFMGHSHSNDYREINGIHYCTLDAVIGNTGPGTNAYSLLEIFSDGSLKLNGFGKHSENPMVKIAPRLPV